MPGPLLKLPFSTCGLWGRDWPALPWLWRSPLCCLGASLVQPHVFICHESTHQPPGLATGMKTTSSVGSWARAVSSCGKPGQVWAAAVGVKALVESTPTQRGSFHSCHLFFSLVSRKVLRQESARGRNTVGPCLSDGEFQSQAASGLSPTRSLSPLGRTRVDGSGARG